MIANVESKLLIQNAKTEVGDKKLIELEMNLNPERKKYCRECRVQLQFIYPLLVQIYYGKHIGIVFRWT